MPRPKFIATATGQVVIFDPLEVHREMTVRLGLDVAYAGEVAFPHEKDDSISYFGQSTSLGIKADGFPAPKVDRWFGTMLHAGTHYQTVMLTNDKSVLKDAGYDAEKADLQGIVDDCGNRLWIPAFGELTLKDLARFSGRYGPVVYDNEIFAIDES
jgi:hypothetical protein